MMQCCRSGMRCASLSSIRTGTTRDIVTKRWLSTGSGTPCSDTRRSIDLQAVRQRCNRPSIQCCSIRSRKRSPNDRYYSSSSASAAASDATSDSFESPLSDTFRSAMRKLTHPVVVLTASDSDGAQSPRAMTMSSFTSLSLSPTPLITFNVAVPSRSFEALSRRGEFNIHILSSDQHGVDIANHFTKGSGDGVFDGISYETDALSGSPVIMGEGVLHVLRCRLAIDDTTGSGMLRVRDHVIVIAEVLDMVPRTATARKEEGGFGLAYMDRKYRRPGSTI